MKKYSFLDKFRLTDRFKEGKVSLIIDNIIDADEKKSVIEEGRYYEFSDGERIHTKWAVGDSVVVMSSYRDEGLDERIFGNSQGWMRKQCANPKYMLNHFVVDRVRCVRVQDITEEEFLRMGVTKTPNGLYHLGGECGGFEQSYRELLKRYFDKISRVPYAMNPWVVLYDITPCVAVRLEEVKYLKEIEQ